jgi:SAM-dependent methyltransferase
MGVDLAVGIDISEVSIQNCVQNAKRDGLEAKTRFLQRDCEDTGLPDACVDRVLCNGMLHHLDLSRAFPELDRILAPGGEIFCYEALEYNPAIKLYRNLTPDLRTEWEKDHILGLQDLRNASRWFDVKDIQYHCLVSPLATFLPTGPIRDAGIRVGWAVDSVLTRVPGLRLWSWIFTFRLVKKAG